MNRRREGHSRNVGLCVLKKMLRICFQSVGVVENRRVNGKIVHESQDELTQSWVDIFDALNKNNSYFVARKNFVECYEQMKNNQSDLITELYSPSTNESLLYVPAPNTASLVTMLSGYSWHDVVPFNPVSALQNFTMLDGSVYLVYSLFIVLFTLLVVASALLRLYRTIIWREGHSTGRAHRLQRNLKITGDGRVRSFVKEQILLFFRGHSKSFRSTTLLLLLLTFYVAVYFNAVYSTSNIVLKKPVMVDTYGKLVKHRTATGIFIAFFVKASDSFRDSHRSSVKGKIWNKFITQYREFDIDDANFEISQGPILVEKAFQLMRTKKAVAIASSTTVKVVRAWVCALTPPSQQRYLTIITDPSEHEEILGFALATRYTRKREVLRALRLFNQSGVFGHFMKRFESMNHEWWAKLVGRTDAEIFRQHLACTGEYEADMSHALKAVPLDFWKSFIFTLLGVHIFSLIVLSGENIHRRF